MKDFIRVISLMLNLVLVGLLTASLWWIWRMSQSDDSSASAETAGAYEGLYADYLVNGIRERAQVGKSFPVVEMADIDGNTVKTDFFSVKAAMVLLFDPAECQPCLNTQLKALQFIHSRLRSPEEFPVYAFARAKTSGLKRYRRAFDLTYPLISDLEGTVIDSSLTDYTPVVYLVGPDNQILDCHRPVLNKSEFSILFYNQTIGHRIRNNLKISIDLTDSPFMMAGTSLLDIIRDQYDNSRVQDFLN